MGTEDGSESVKSRRKWNRALTIIAVILLAAGIYACSRQGPKERAALPHGDHAAQTAPAPGRW